MTDAANADVNDLTFERAMQELEAIVQRLEKGDVALEDSMALYARGEALKGRCETLLKSAEARIEAITVGADGKPSGTKPLDAG